MVKWLVIGFLGTLLIISVLIAVLAWQFSPLISVDEATQRVQLFRGLIDVTGDSVEVKVGPKLIIGDKPKENAKGSVQEPAKESDKEALKEDSKEE